MPDLKEYEVQINGIPHTVQLSDEDAKRDKSAQPVTRAKAASAPANKAVTPENK